MTEWFVRKVKIGHKGPLEIHEIDLLETIIQKDLSGDDVVPPAILSLPGESDIGKAWFPWKETISSGLH